MPWPDTMEVRTLDGTLIGRYTYDQYEREFGYSVVGRAASSSQKKAAGPAVQSSARKQEAKNPSESSPSPQTVKSTGVKKKRKKSKKAAQQRKSNNQSSARLPEVKKKINTKAWTEEQLERLERIVDAMGEEKAVDIFLETDHRDPKDTRNHIEMLRPHKGEPKEPRPSADNQPKIRPKPSNESGEWTYDEDEMLKAFAADFTKEEVYELFPKRKHFDVDARLKELHLKTLPTVEKPNEQLSARSKGQAGDVKQTEPQKTRKSKPKAVDWSSGMWSGSEVAQLRQSYPTALHDDRLLLRLFPNHGLSEIHDKAEQLGLVKKSPLRQRSVKREEPGTDRRNEIPGSGQVPKVILTQAPKPKLTKNAAKRLKRKLEAQNTLGETQKKTAAAPSEKPPNKKAKPAPRVWTPAEDSIVREYYLEKGIDWAGWKEKLPGVSLSEIEQRGKGLLPPTDDALAALAAKFNKGR